MRKIRDIKFRGKTTDDKWVYGSLVKCEYGLKGKYEQPKAWIVENAFSNGGWFTIRKKTFVYLDSVCEFTCFKDCNGKDIYEYDEILAEGYNPDKGYIEMIDGAWSVWFGDDNYVTELNHFYTSKGIGVEVIGNCFE